MRKFYTVCFFLLCLVQLVPGLDSAAQCVNGNEPTPVMFDTTIYFDPGVTNTQVKFPKIDPETGMLTCVKLRVTMTGVIDTVYMQNLTNSAQSANFNYDRKDDMTGPGLTTALTNSAGVQYGPYSVTSYDGNFTSGTDYASIPRDTVLNKTVERKLTDSTEISQFYGHDSVTYNYNIDVKAIATMTGGNSMFMVRTSAFVRFRFEYCKCDKVTLPVGLKNFAVTKSGTQTADLYWEGLKDEDNYVYDVEVSRDGLNFTRASTIEKKYTTAPRYIYSFAAKNTEPGKYYFRVRQRWPNGYVRFTPVKTVEFINPSFASVSLYPNPSNGSAGIKFVNAKAGRVMVQVTGTSGQHIMSKEMQVAETDYKTLGLLPAGMYWVKITDAATKASCVKQLIVR